MVLRIFDFALPRGAISMAPLAKASFKSVLSNLESNHLNESFKSH
jgi:hypothetical protein